MGSKRFDCLSDFWRHGQHVHLTCGNGRCDHAGVVDAYAASTYFRLHRWSEHLEWDCLSHFRCSLCGHAAGQARPTENAVTVTSFFPADQKGWQMLQRRLRG